MPDLASNQDSRFVENINKDIVIYQTKAKKIMRVSIPGNINWAYAFNRYVILESLINLLISI